MQRSIWILLALLLLASCSSSRDLMPTPTVLADTEEDPFAEVPAVFQSDTMDVFYATDRGPETDEEGRLSYTDRRSRSLAYGSVVVGISESPGWETLKRESRTANRELDLELEIRSITEQGRLPETPLPQDGGRDEEARIASEHLRAEISRRLALSERKELFIFVHGFANDFEDGAFVIAELWHFLGRIGVPVTYGWPAGSGGLLRGYNRDRESGEFTVFHLKQFLRTVASIPELRGIHLLAHSRGTDVATTAIRELMIEANATGRTLPGTLKLRNLVLLSPDLDMEVASQRIGAERIADGVGTMTIYVSGHDRAIGLAEWLFDSTIRVGRFTFQDMTEEQRRNLTHSHGLEVIEFTAESSGVGHSYFRLHPLASSDLILLLRDGRAPGAGNGRPLEAMSDGYWLLTDDYLKK
jgi:esterase/lipase superfamily enzyme